LSSILPLSSEELLFATKDLLLFKEILRRKKQLLG
jgi:hypothetical protein